MQWSPRYIVIPAVSVVFALLRRYLPAPKSKFKSWKFEDQQAPEPLPTGVIGAFMWLIAILLLLTFFGFRTANHAWAAMDNRAILRLYPTSFIWCFFPGFAALSIPWPFTIWLLQRLKRSDEADAIAEGSNSKTGFDSFTVMKWLAIGLGLPIGIATIFAIPIHLSIEKEQVRVGHFGSLSEEIFPLAEAKRAVLSDGALYRDGFHPQRDLFLFFNDGRILRANAIGDGGTDADPKAVELLIRETGLVPEHVRTLDTK